MDDRKTTPNDPLSAAEFPIGAGGANSHRSGDDAPMTDAQAAELRELCETRGEPMDGHLTRTQAADRIEALKAQE